MVTADSLAHVVNDVAYIVVTPAGPATPELRFYPRAMSVAARGAKVSSPAAVVGMPRNIRRAAPGARRRGNRHFQKGKPATGRTSLKRVIQCGGSWRLHFDLF